MSTAEAPPDARARLVRRTTVLLAAVQALLWGALGVFAAFAPLVGRELTGRFLEGGILFAVYYVGTAAGARVAGRAMDRYGRRPGLAAGYVVFAISGVVSYLAVVARSPGLLRAASFLVGVGVGAALLGRAAVADLYPPEQRGRAVGIVIMAGTVGAVGGAPLGAALASLGVGGGTVDARAAPFLLMPLLALLALVLVLALRPDPRELAVTAPGTSRAARAPHEVLLSRGGIVPVVTIGAAQAVMVTFMSVIPVVVHDHGASDLTVTIVVGLHLGAMFVFSPLVGSVLDAWGRRIGLMLAVGLLAAGVAIALLDTGALIGGAGLFVIGIGWSAAYVASTAIVSDLTRPEERAGALGSMDLVAGLTAATGVFGGALLLDATSLTTLGFTGLALLVVPLALVASMRPSTAPRG